MTFATAAIAQLGERQTEDLKVPGSIPGLGIIAWACNMGRVVFHLGTRKILNLLWSLVRAPRWMYCKYVESMLNGIVAMVAVMTVTRSLVCFARPRGSLVLSLSCLSRSFALSCSLAPSLSCEVCQFISIAVSMSLSRSRCISGALSNSLFLDRWGFGVRGPRLQVRGSRFEVRGSRFEVRGSRFEVRGSRFEVQDSRVEVRGLSFEVRGSRSEVRGSRVEGRGPRFEGRRSRFEVRGSRFKVRDSRFEV